MCAVAIRSWAVFAHDDHDLQPHAIYMIPHDDMSAPTALSDLKVTRQCLGRVRIVLRAGRLRIVEPHHDTAPHVPSVTPVLAERPARRRWWRR